MTPRADPIAAIATAPGRGAVGIVRISGAALGALAQAVTGCDLTPRTAHYGPFLDAAGQPIDHGIALFFPAPHSYTGEDVLELQAHGGPVVLQLLLARCLGAAAAPDPATGAPALAHLRLARPGEFTERAFLNGKLDLAQAEAVADLIDASNAAAARSASRSLTGAFSGAVHALRDGLIGLRLLIEATLDFPEEETDILSARDVRGQLSNLQQQLLTVQGQARQGALLAEGIRVVIAGQPNAGKSSLLNALAGQDLAIVTPVAGTTRDALRHALQIDGVPVHVVDTAGLRADGGPVADPVERIGIERAWQHITGADAVLFLHDLTRAGDAAYRAGDAAIAGELAGKLPASAPVLQVWNKSDAAADAPDDAGALVISARTGAGLDALRARLLHLAGWQGGSGEGLFLARQRHVQALARAGAHLDAAAAHLRARAPLLDLIAEELRLAQNALGEITGEFGADDLLGAIFSRFCIGK
ncbi:MAG: tRNA uridine-5-carboxymethylaminomethyl(34) synthesis GTPase MnmE [Burkholderiaceae bacterium]|jgi:tRNA modification GTPase|nr:tRNA uridine-5-carboxymethylaminomethyl(34) synthesis GTPase MnmE [Burkholderiaceae bacterium]